MLAAAFVAGLGCRRLSARPGSGSSSPSSSRVGFALVHGYASITQRGNQVVSGVAINMLAAGLAVVLGNTWFKEGGRTPALPPEGRFLPIELPGAAALARRSRPRLPRQGLPVALDPRLYGLPAGAAHRLGAGRARASACGCAPWARTRMRSTRPASRWRAALPRGDHRGRALRHRRRLSSRSRCRRASCAT